MAVGEGKLPEFYPVAGIRLGVACAGINRPGRRDLVIVEMAEGATVAGVFTQNQFCAAPVIVAKKHLEVTSPRYFLINTGNANAGTGARGMDDAMACCRALAEHTGVDVQAVLPFSTGVIGEPLPVESIVSGIPSALGALNANHWPEAAEGIMTTDTRPKGATRCIDISGKRVVISGISKGAGMICPNMATMLAFVATDADIPSPLLQKILSRTADRTFNRITVDGDTSTNDACMLIATGKAGVRITEGSPEEASFSQAFYEVLRDLAQAIVRDGEGATKFVEVVVTEANNRENALRVAYAVAHSPLVKTALFASDPNWGRILAAVGRAGVRQLDISRVTIWLNDVCIVEQGARSATYSEALGQKAMASEEITIRIGLGLGEISETVWTTDLSHDYVTINAEYRT